MPLLDIPPNFPDNSLPERFDASLHLPEMEPAVLSVLTNLFCSVYALGVISLGFFGLDVFHPPLVPVFAYIDTITLSRALFNFLCVSLAQLRALPAVL